MEEGNNPGDHLDLKRIERRLERTEDLLLRLMTITEGFQAQLHQLQGRLDRKGQVSLQSSDSSDEHHLPSVSSSESSSSSEEEYEDHREAGSDDEQTVRPAQVILTSSLQIIPEGFEALHRHFPEETERAISREVTVVIPDGFEAVPPVSPPQISENENLIDGFDPEDVYPVWGDADSDYQEDIEDSEENTGHKPQIKDALEILPDINGDGSISDSGSSSSQSSSPSPPPPPPALNSFTQRLMALIVAPIPDLKDGKLNSSGLNRPVLSSPGLQNLEMDILREIVDELKADWTSLELPKLNKQKEWDRVHRDNLFEQYREDLVHLEKRLQKIMEDIALANLGATREVLKKKSGSLEATVHDISRVEFLLSLKDAERPENEVGTPLRNRRKVTTEGTENIGGGNEDDDLDGFIVPDDDEEERPLEEGAEAETARDVNMVSQHKEGRENHGEGAVESPIVVEETDNMEVDSDPDVVIYKVVEGRSCENAEIEDEMSQNCGLGQMKLLEEMALHGNTHFSERLLNAPTAESRKRVAVEQRRKGAKDTRKKARKIISDEDLNAETKAARAMQQQRKEQLERERIIAEGRAKLRSRADGDGVIINPAAESKDIVKINPYIASNLLQHQIDAVRFEWSLINSGTGCLLALCMGLGKTLCAIALLHTYLKKYPNQRGLVVVPANVLQNWDIEFEKWLPPDEEGLKQFLIGDEKGDKVREKRIEKLRSWKKNGGVVIISYHMLYELTEKQGTKYTSAQRQELQELLQDPGPDIVVADEAHVIRNDKSNLSRTLKSIKTRKRICLTGYPLQNNLNEYWCMFDFISPNLLGTMTEFSNRFTNPINSGRHRDSTFEESQISKRRSFQLHEELKLLMFRKSDLLLAEMLPPKLELVICCKMADVQHEYFCSANESLKNNELMDTKSAKLFSGFNALTLIGNHPKSFEYAMNREQDKGPDDDAAEVAVSSMSLKKKLEGYSGKFMHEFVKA
eukprot:TRINITY_DN6520_c0_g1_i3.p1 TRINITY_DN6520_c0_g1~~TRINITY_DN6520_c0_g1_i3.p1  ORF type:complete len:978 (-),score=162.34 TRINITY_DN6520_c0_g1_i3:662-3595(-)